MRVKRSTLGNLIATFALESPVVTATEPDAAHAARSEFALEHVRPKTATGQRRQRIQKIAERRIVAAGQQQAERSSDFRSVALELHNPGLALARREIHGLVEPGARGPPGVEIHAAHSGHLAKKCVRARVT
jgi:hypothetical protein